MALSSIKDVNGLKDPLRMYQITLTFADGVKTLSNFAAKQMDKVSNFINNSVLGDLGFGVGSIMGPNGIILQKDFVLRCQSFTYPGAKIHKTDLVLFNHAKSIPVFNDKSGVLSVEVTEDMERSVLQAINNWCDVIHNNFDGVMGSSEFYSTNCMMDILDQNMHHTRRIYLHGVWPLEVKPITVKTSDSSPVNVAIDFNYDWYSETNTFL